MQRLKKFFSEIFREMRKVSWPKRKELTAIPLQFSQQLPFLQYSLLF